MKLNKRTEPEQPLLKPKGKTGPKKPYERTEKQKEQFKIAMYKRQENIIKRNEQKKIEAAKLLLEKEIELQPRKKQQQPPPSESSSESEMDEIPPPPQKQKVKTKKIYVIEKKANKHKKIYVI
jgi:hypothetical protein